MSLVFSNAAANSGIIEVLDRTLGTTDDSYPIAEKVSDINLALDALLALIFEAGGKWKFDDSNHTDYPIITCDIVQGQRDYSFTVDGSGNLILEIFKVFIKTQATGGGSGIFQEIYPADPSSESGLQNFTNGLNVQATPFLYQKLGNGILLDPIPGYSQADSLKMYIDREAFYFTTADTTRKPGFASLFHEYLVLRPAYKYAQRNQLALAGGVLRNGSLTGLLRDVSIMEKGISSYYGNRARDERQKMEPRITRFK